MLRRRISPHPAAAVAISSSGLGVAFSARYQSSSTSVGDMYAGYIKQQQQQQRGHSNPRREHHQQQRDSAPNSAGGASWLERVQAEMITERDPLQGQYHKDYFRDPSAGYAPVFAPRNFENGGEVDYFHPLSSTHYATSLQDREAASHAFERRRHEARGARGALRSAPSAGQSEALSRLVPEDPSWDRSSVRSSHPAATIADAFRDAVRSGTRSHNIGSMASAGSAPLQPGMSPSALRDSMQTAEAVYNDNLLDEGLRMHHGLREKERYEFEFKQRTERLPFRGYDMDRYIAGQTADLHGMNPLGQSPLVAPGTTAEAQQNVRRNAVRDRESHIAKALHNNTVKGEPKLGEALTEEIVDSLHADRNEKAANASKERDARFGLGRQGPLVQDGGPDKRALKRHKNDERLLNAMIFDAQAYRASTTDTHADPVERNKVTEGVGHLLRNQFDISRRVQNIAAGRPDPTERATQHYGKPVLQEQDEFVFRRRNARGERTLEYFKPFPQFRDLRLQRVYRDVEGFPLLKQRPDFLEWELFCRYRGHFEQRREIALRHGLEPKPNETVAERDARRQQVDELCEKTPFDAARFATAMRKSDEMDVDAHNLRAWFGWYVLPSPTIVEAVLSHAELGLPTQCKMDELNTADEREHVLSARYLNKLFQNESYRFRIGRGSVQDLIGSIPNPEIAFKQPPSVLQHFTAAERAVYDAYVKRCVDKHVERWERALGQQRRWIPVHQQHATVIGTSEPLTVYDAERIADGAVITIGADEMRQAIDAALQDPSNLITIPGKGECRLLAHSKRQSSVVRLRLEKDGRELEMDEGDFNKCEIAADSEGDVNVALRVGKKSYDYNRSNYVETQDKIWEENTVGGTEGWSPATHADGLRPGVAVACCRLIDQRSRTRGDLTRGVIVQYFKQPFFNPEPRTITVSFPDGTVEQIPLSCAFIWQRQYYGPERTVGDATRRLNTSLRRYINVADPNGEKTSANRVHFLDKYEGHSPQRVADSLESLKQITEVDEWRKFDTDRSTNHRSLTISHRKDYIRQGYLLRYTPWSWIALQEADQPMLTTQMRSDDVGPAYHHTPNRYWRFKARPYGYIRNFEHEVRDAFQYVDAVTPWEKAKKVRTYFEVREHHPMPQFNRPEVAIHRNHMGLLPSHMWEADKKTGRVKAVKDSVRDYQTQTPLPAWAQL